MTEKKINNDNHGDDDEKKIIYIKQQMQLQSSKNIRLFFFLEIICVRHVRNSIPYRRMIAARYYGFVPNTQK